MMWMSRAARVQVMGIPPDDEGELIYHELKTRKKAPSTCIHAWSPPLGISLPVAVCFAGASSTSCPGVWASSSDEEGRLLSSNSIFSHHSKCTQHRPSI